MWKGSPILFIAKYWGKRVFGVLGRPHEMRGPLLRPWGGSVIETKNADGRRTIVHESYLREHGALCLRCAEMFPMPIGRRVVCPECCWSIYSSDFEELWSLSRRTFRYGHQYRRTYERQFSRPSG